jgi:hypothetical protein
MSILTNFCFVGQQFLRCYILNNHRKYSVGHSERRPSLVVAQPDV